MAAYVSWAYLQIMRVLFLQQEISYLTQQPGAGHQNLISTNTVIGIGSEHAGWGKEERTNTRWHRSGVRQLLFLGSGWLVGWLIPWHIQVHRYGILYCTVQYVIARLHLHS